MIKQRGFVFLSVVLTMSLVAIIAYGLNRENGMNASLLGRQSDIDRARYAAEAGLQAVNADVQSENCSGYATSSSPIADTDFGGATYSAYASASSGSPLTLTSTGSYNGTSVTLTRGNSYAYRSSTQDYVLQPNATAGIDTYLQSGSATNFGVAGSMTVNGSRYPLIKFNLSMFPAGSIPENLSLQLWNDNLAPVTANVFRMQSGWQEGSGASTPVDGANWATSNGSSAWGAAGGDYHPTSIASDIAAGTWLDLDIADLGLAWMTGRYPNHGVRLSIVNSWFFAGDIFLSDNANNSKRPKLVFEYWEPCGTSGP